VRKFLNKILCREKLKFELTNNEKNQIITTLEKILKTKGFSINLSGKFINDNEFELTDKISIGIYIQGGGNPAILKGKFTNDSNKNMLSIFAKSHILFPLVTILVPSLIIPLMLTSEQNNTNEKILSVIFGIFIMIVMTAGGNLYKNRLLKKTIRELGLKN
jgi:hypothetical protein